MFNILNDFATASVTITSCNEELASCSDLPAIIRDV